ncbi:MAG: hypothetical protein HYS15_01070 [Candidatus Spechtbacteria bacterium]|nr:hypothetical protein [Candidatus Spechtbacteria bacterium]
MDNTIRNCDFAIAQRKIRGRHGKDFTEKFAINSVVSEIMDSYIIQIQPQDELTSIIDKIIHTEAEQVYLLVPDSSRIAQHALNFRLLKREADALGKEVIIVSASQRVHALALKSSLKAHQETAELKREAVKKNGSGTATVKKVSDIVASDILNPYITKTNEKKSRGPDRQDKKIEAALQKVEMKNFGGKIASFWKKEQPVMPRAIPLGGMYAWIVRRSNARMIFKASLVFFAGISLVLMGVTFYSVLPKAKIYVEPIRREVDLEITITGDTNESRADNKKGVIPVQIFVKSVEGSKTIKTTTEKEVNAKAHGVVKIYNSYSSAPQTLVQNTRFISETGKLFRTTETVLVAGAKIEEGNIVPSFTMAKVVASEAGEEYNIGPATFSIPGFKGTPKYLAFYAKSDGKMEGGKIGRVKVVSEEDYRNGVGELSRTLEAQAKAELALAVPSTFTTPEGGAEQSPVEVTSSKNVSDEAEEFTLAGSLALSAFALRELDVLPMLAEEFRTKFPGEFLTGKNKSLQYEIKEKDFKKGVLKIKAMLKDVAETSIDAKKMRDGIRGKKEDDVRSYLASFPGIKQARVVFWPFWVTNIPEDAARIQVIID